MTDGTAHSAGGTMDHKSRMLISGAGIAGLSAIGQLIFVSSKLPDIFWTDFLGGIFAAVVTAFLLVLVRPPLRQTQ